MHSFGTAKIALTLPRLKPGGSGSSPATLAGVAALLRWGVDT